MVTSPCHHQYPPILQLGCIFTVLLLSKRRGIGAVDSEISTRHCLCLASLLVGRWMASQLYPLMGHSRVEPRAVLPLSLRYITVSPCTPSSEYLSQVMKGTTVHSLSETPSLLDGKDSIFQMTTLVGQTFESQHRLQKVLGQGTGSLRDL